MADMEHLSVKAKRLPSRLKLKSPTDILDVLDVTIVSTDFEALKPQNFLKQNFHNF